MLLMSLIPGRNFGHYEILRLLGRGGMGEVYLARDKTLKRFVAIKIISPQLLENSEQVRRFQKEASFAAALNHPNICTIHETGEIDGLTYICMEHVEGDTLRHYISSREVTIQEVLDIAIQIADALDEAHKKNVIHRDIKTSNVLLTPRKFVKILDFGLAKQLPRFKGDHLSDTSTDSLLTGPGNPIRGTTAYMSPEAILGKQVDNRSDIFSFGVVLYEMLTGRLPFTGNSATEIMDEILHKDATVVTRYNDKVPDALVHILKKMLEKDPENRYQSVHEVWIDLRRLRDESFRTGTITPTQVDQVRSYPKRNWILPGAIILAVLCLILYFVLHKSFKPSSTTHVETAAKKKAIAVLPFRYSGDPEHKYFAQLVTDALIAGLESEPGLAIAPYGTVKDYNNATNQVISRELGVDWIVKGTFTNQDSTLVIKSEMLSAKGETLWNQEISASADRLVSTLETLKTSLLAKLEEGKSSAKAIDLLRTPNMDAYKYYVEARNRQEQWDKEENLEEAMVLYRKAIEIDPDFAAAHAGLAQALVNKYLNLRTPSILVEAIAEANKGITQDPNLPETLLASGLVQLQTGNSVEARISFSKALDLAPGNDAACRSIASAQEELGRQDDAKKMYERAIELRPNYWRNHYALGRFLYISVGNFDEAKLHLLKANELYPEGSSPLVVLGLIALARGELNTAEAYFRKVLDRGPDFYALTNLGLIYYCQQKYDLALRTWQAAIQQAPDDSTIQSNIADAYRAMGEQTKAREHYLLAINGYRRAIASNAKDYDSRAGLAMAMSALGRCEEAREEIRTVLGEQSKNPELAANAAVTAARCGDHKWAVQIVLDSISTENLREIRFHPDLETIRQVPEVKRALAQHTSSSS
jgi:serine/threonine protein kinase/Tfp pilus assembly protein PilF